MLAPQSNASRTILDFSGVWDFRLKPDAPWQSIAVPASYNDQSADPEFRRHVGLAWYRRSITVPSLLKGQRLMLRFDAVTHTLAFSLMVSCSAPIAAAFCPSRRT